MTAALSACRVPQFPVVPDADGGSDADPDVSPSSLASSTPRTPARCRGAGTALATLAHAISTPADPLLAAHRTVGWSSVCVRHARAGGSQYIVRGGRARDPLGVLVPQGLTGDLGEHADPSSARRWPATRLDGTSAPQRQAGRRAGRLVRAGCCWCRRRRAAADPSELVTDSPGGHVALDTPGLARCGRSGGVGRPRPGRRAAVFGQLPGTSGCRPRPTADEDVAAGAALALLAARSSTHPWLGADEAAPGCSVVPRRELLHQFRGAGSWGPRVDDAGRDRYRDFAVFGGRAGIPWTPSHCSFSTPRPLAADAVVERDHSRPRLLHSTGIRPRALQRHAALVPAAAHRIPWPTASASGPHRSPVRAGQCITMPVDEPYLWEHWRAPGGRGRRVELERICWTRLVLHADCTRARGRDRLSWAVRAARLPAGAGCCMAAADGHLVAASPAGDRALTRAHQLATDPGDAPNVYRRSPLVPHGRPRSATRWTGDRRAPRRGVGRAWRPTNAVARPCWTDLRILPPTPRAPGPHWAGKPLRSGPVPAGAISRGRGRRRGAGVAGGAGRRA